MSDFIQSLPKAELHLHIEGAIPLPMVREHLSSWPESPPWWADDYRFESFPHFAQIMRQCYGATLTSVENYYRAALGIYKSLVAQNVRYVELSFSLGHALSIELPLLEIVNAMKQAAPDELIVRVFCGISRSRPQLLQERLLDNVLDIAGLDGIDLHGDERAQGPGPFSKLFRQAREKGLFTKAHAGELAGPSSMKSIIDTLELTRIEHGVTAIQDDLLISQLINDAITLDLCPSSNLKLRVVEDMSQYPIRELHQRGVRITVNTDNPTILGCTLTEELRLLVEQFDFTQADLVQLQANAFETAIISPAERSELLLELETLGRVDN